MTPHTGGNKQQNRDNSFSQTLYRSSLDLGVWASFPITPPSSAEHNMTTHRAEYPRQYTAESPWQHITMQIFQTTYCQALDAFQYANGWQLSYKKKQASCLRPFFTQEEHPRGGPTKTQASDTHQAYKHRGKLTNILSQSYLCIDGLWCSCFSLYPSPISPPFSVLFLCWFYIVFFSPPFYERAHSDPFNASRVMQVWLSVSADRLPSLKRRKRPPALRSEHGKPGNEPRMATIKTKPRQRVKTKRGLVDVLSVVVKRWKGGRKVEEWVETGAQGWRGSVLAEERPLPAHCVLCSMCGAVSTCKDVMTELSDLMVENYLV